MSKHVAPPRDSAEYEWHRETCDTCHDAEQAELYKQWIADGSPLGEDEENEVTS